MEENASSRLHYLFQQYLENAITEEEYAEFWKLLQKWEDKESLSGRLQELWEAARDAPPLLTDAEWTEKLRLAKAAQQPPAYRKLFVRAAAAILVLVAGTAGYLFMNNGKPAEAPALTVQKQVRTDVMPGGNKAILTLADGSSMALDSVANGRIGLQGNISIVKLDSGRLAYRAENAASDEVVYNTLTTPRGGQFQLLLPDGSRVWLNAGSSIRFPNIFAGKERTVSISGEAYFEVAADAQKPFIVNAEGTRIDVLGTHFNVQAYKGDRTTTTLLEGSVRVTKGTSSMLLKPAQQAMALENGDLRLMDRPDLEEVMAWKKGLFWLNGTDIHSLARQLSLWYDIDIVIEGNISQRFTGTIPRNVTVSKVFEVLQETGSLHYAIEDNRIIVSP